MNVYTLRYKTAWSGDEMLMVYSNLRAVINRLEIMDLHDNFDEDETVIIECMEVTSEETRTSQQLNTTNWSESNIIFAIIGMVGLFSTAVIWQRANRITGRYYGKSKSLDDNYFIKNAILCWLHHYGDQGHRWDDIYKELAQRDTYINKDTQ